MRLYSSSLTLQGSLLQGSLLQGENPQPCFRALPRDLPCYQDGTLTPEEQKGFGVACGARVLPYRMQDRYTRHLESVCLETVVLENEHLKATFLPGMGAKLWSLYSKDEKRELLFKNSVFRPANLANRNAWTCGGIEWNLGHHGHHALTCDNFYCASVTSPEGETFLRVYEYEATQAQILQIDFHLPDGAVQLAAHVRIENTLAEEQPVYWWTNTAMPLTPHTRVFSGTSDLLYQLTPKPGQPAQGFGRCQMPTQPNLACEDISYPMHIPHSLEYFFQNSHEDAAPWEVCIEKDGRGLLERSTQPLFARKMFCWGNATGGRHWCDFLAEPGKGDYIEIQAGLAPTQLHTAVLAADASLCFTQWFGAIRTPQEGQTLEWNAARPFVEACVKEALPQAAMEPLHAEYRRKALLTAQKLLHTGGYYGGLEQCRRRAERLPAMAPHLDFPEPPTSHPFAVWCELLRGQRPAATAQPWPYLTDPRWLSHMERALAGGAQSAQLQFQYAVSLAENGREAEAARALESLAGQKDPWALHMLGALAHRAGKLSEATEYALRAYQAEAGRMDASFAEDALQALVETERFGEAWELYNSIPPQRRTESEELAAAAAAVKLGQWEFLEQTFQKEHALLREGAAGLTEIWFETQARQRAEKNGVPFAQEQIDRTLSLPRHLDFRMFE